MTNVIARIKIKGKHFEILVDVDKAIALKKGEGGNIREILAFDSVFIDSKKGKHASESDLKECFGTEDVYIIAEKIIKNGEIQVTAENRSKEREDKIKQIVDFLTRTAIDAARGVPFTPDRINEALKKAGVNVDNRPIEEQIPSILQKLKPIIPIKLETKRLKIVIPAIYTGKVYGLIKDYKESEEWLSDGSLSAVIDVPIGLQMEFYDKLNKMTQGSAVTEEIKEE